MKGYICPCCGIRKDFDELNSQSDGTSFPFCQPCGGSNSALPDLSPHHLPASNPVCVLDVQEAFMLLTNEEKTYAYWVGKASWEGSLICLRQCSPESTPIFCLLLKIFSSRPIDDIIVSAQSDGMSEEEISQILVYTAGIGLNRMHRSFINYTLRPHSILREYG